MVAVRVAVRDVSASGQRDGVDGRLAVGQQPRALASRRTGRNVIRLVPAVRQIVESDAGIEQVRHRDRTVMMFLEIIGQFAVVAVHPAAQRTACGRTVREVRTLLPLLLLDARRLDRHC